MLMENKPLVSGQKAPAPSYEGPEILTVLLELLNRVCLNGELPELCIWANGFTYPRMRLLKERCVYNEDTGSLSICCVSVATPWNTCWFHCNKNTSSHTYPVNDIKHLIVGYPEF
jgi:hypothetical protein